MAIRGRHFSHSYTPAATGSVEIWRAPAACIITGVTALRVGGTSATVMVKKQPAAGGSPVDLLTGDISAGTSWTDGTLVADPLEADPTETNPNALHLAAGDRLVITTDTFVGSPTSLRVQVDGVFVDNHLA